MLRSLKYFVQVILSGCQDSLSLPPPTRCLLDDCPYVLQGPWAPVRVIPSVKKESRSSVGVTQVTAVIRNGPDSRGTAGRFIISSPGQSGTLQVRRLLLGAFQLDQGESFFLSHFQAWKDWNGWNGSTEKTEH